MLKEGTIELVPYFPILRITSHGFQHLNMMKEVVIPVNFVKYMIGTLVVIVALAIHVMHTVNDVFANMLKMPLIKCNKLSIYYTQTF